MMNAIVLAGNDKNGEAKLGIANKAFLTVCGRLMVEYVVEALRASGEVNKISIVGPVERLKEVLGDRVDYYFEAVDCIFENITIGVQPFQTDNRILVITSDVPMLTGKVVTDFIEVCRQSGADLCYPILEKKVNEQQFPGFTRTYVKLKSGTYTGGNIFYVNPAIISACKDFIVKVIEYRKKPWKTGRMLGFRFLIMLLMGTLTISGLEKRFSELLKIKAAAVVSLNPELANDIDKISDLHMVEKYMSITLEAAKK